MNTQSMHVYLEEKEAIFDEEWFEKLQKLSLALHCTPKDIDCWERFLS
jgi:hypothetical protein